MRRGSGINKGTNPEQSAKRVQEERQGRRRRVQEISGKDVHNMNMQPLTLPKGILVQDTSQWCALGTLHLEAKVEPCIIGLTDSSIRTQTR